MTEAKDPRYIEPEFPDAPVAVADIDLMIRGVATTPPNILGLISLVARAAIISVLFGIREKLISAACRKAKQKFEQDLADKKQDEIDNEDMDGK